MPAAKTSMVERRSRSAAPLRRAWRLALLIFAGANLSLNSQATFASEAAPGSAAIPGVVRIEVFPAKVDLKAKREAAQVVVTGYLADGEAVDLGRDAKFSWTGDAKAARVEGTRIVPLANGETTLSVEAAGHAAKVSVVVSGQEKADPVRFRTEVTAALTKQGCNVGSCHGAPDGKGGFALSMLAYKPSIDQENLVGGALTRRVEPNYPSESLLLKKPLLQVSHVGGKKLRPTDYAYSILRDWIGEGAAFEPADTPKVVRIRLHPSGMRLLRGAGAGQQLCILAESSDGRLRDVTRLATYSSSAEAVVGIDADGLASAVRRGQAAVTVRYLDFVESLHVTVVEPVEGFAAAWKNDPPAANYVDTLVLQKLKQLQYLPSEVCDDGVFLRRLHLDLTGLLPTAHQARAFLADAAADKRAKKIDELLASEEFARFWGAKTADLLRVSPSRIEEDRAKLFNGWLVDSWRRNQPFDEFVRELLLSEGSTREVGPANYYQAFPEGNELAETTAQLFMGSRINCAKCHNHPFENWTQDDYYRITAAFVRVRQRDGEVELSAEGETRHPATGQVMDPWGKESFSASEPIPADRRAIFARWLAKAGNPFFARVEVNRIWAHLLGRGIVHPVDDFRSSNPPANPELLAALADDFEKSGFDRKRILRTICNSFTYQRSSVANRFNAEDVALFSHGVPRRLTAEQLRDGIGYVSRTRETVEQSDARLADDRKKLQDRRDRIAAEQPVWEAKARETLKLAPFQAGPWSLLSGFLESDWKKNHAAVYAPEKAVDLSAAVSATPIPPKKQGEEASKEPAAKPEKPAEGKAAEAKTVRWKDAFDLVDGRPYDLPPKPGVCYLFRMIDCPREGEVKVELAADDAVKVWLDGKPVHDLGRKRSFNASQEEVKFLLARGKHELLVKISYSAKKPQFRWTWSKWIDQPVPQPVAPHDVEAFLANNERELPPELRSRAVAFRLETDRDLTSLARGVENRNQRMDYLTQRPYPLKSRFTEAFGQPMRNSACACERSGDPTVDQSLELLNGPEVDSACSAGAAKYEPLKDDSALVEELYLAAYSRRPSERERAAASAHLSGSPNRREAVRDLIWAIVNTQEFLFQH